jgi:hypothetical protein
VQEDSPSLEVIKWGLPRLGVTYKTTHLNTVSQRFTSQTGVSEYQHSNPQSDPH